MSGAQGNSSAPARILVVDDEPSLRRVVSRVLERNGYVCATAEDAEEARVLLAREDFEVLLTDMNMPGDTGLDLMVEVRATYRDVATIMITGVDDPGFATLALRLGAFGYIIKPFEANEILINVSNALRRRELEIENRKHAAGLEQMVQERTAELTDALHDLQDAQEELRSSREETVARLAVVAELRDDAAADHIHRMSRYCALIYKLLGEQWDRCELIRTASVLHDVGKVGIPDSILLAPRALTPDEIEIMRQHSELGHRILTGSDSELLELAATIALTHHEFYDGSGYPRGLAGEDIPLVGRVAAIADVFDALTHDRVYRAAMSVDKAIEIMKSESGTHFDPALLEMFLGAMDEVLRIKEEPASRSGQEALVSTPVD